MYSVPFTTADDESMKCPTAALHRGRHTLVGTPEQFEVAGAENAYRRRSSEPTLVASNVSATFSLAPNAEPVAVTGVVGGPNTGLRLTLAPEPAACSAPPVRPAMASASRAIRSAGQGMSRTSLSRVLR